MAASNVSSTENLTETRNIPEKDDGQQSFSKNLIPAAESESLEIDLAVKCRGCFVEDPEMHYLFTVFDQKLSLADILMQTTPFVCKEDDGFPPYLCTKCTTCLIDFFNFKIQFQKTDIYVRTLLDKSSPENFETVTIKAEVNSDQGSENGDVPEEPEPEPEPLEFEDKFLPDLRKIEDQSQHCQYCDIDFKDIDVRVTHMAKEHGHNPFVKFNIFRKMIVDNEKAELLAKKKMKQMEEVLKEQMLMDMPGKLCKFCRKKFPEEDFKAHWELHKIHICDQCGYKCIKKSDLELHIQGVHGNERNYSCNLCTRAFKTKPLLKRHQTVHLNPRKYVCDLCGQRFNDSGVLKTHIHLKHGGSRDFVCPICGLAFPLKATLEKHIIRHNKNRPPTFYCSLCPSTFRDKSSMSRHHLVKHTNQYQRPVCDFCGKSYSTKTKLRMHVERHHSGTAYERKRRGPKIKDEPYSSSEGEESEESSGSYENRSRGPRVRNVSKDFYRNHHEDSYPARTTEGDSGFLVFEKEGSEDEKDTEGSQSEMDE